MQKVQSASKDIKLWAVKQSINSHEQTRYTWNDIVGI